MRGIRTTPDEAVALRGKRVKFHTDDGVVTMWVKRVECPYVYGLKSARVHEFIEIRVDLRKVHRIEIREVSARRTIALLTLGPVVIAVIVLMFVAIAVAVDPPGLKSAHE